MPLRSLPGLLLIRPFDLSPLRRVRWRITWQQGRASHAHLRGRSTREHRIDEGRFRRRPARHPAARSGGHGWRSATRGSTVVTGSIAKVFTRQGGRADDISVDESGRLATISALERRPTGLKTVRRSRRGTSSACAARRHTRRRTPPQSHFDVFELNADKKLWQGRALDTVSSFKEMS